MRNVLALFLLFVFGLLVCPAVALDLETDVDWFSLTGWDHSTITGGGQVFSNVFPGVDLTVTANGSFTMQSKVKGVGDQLIISAHSTPGLNTFNFSLSSSLPMVIEYRTVDLFEKLTVDTAGAKSHVHLLGAPPTVMTAGTKMIVEGKDVGIPGAGNMTTGASAGFVSTASVSSFAVSHEGLANQKFEAFRIGTMRPVPEPAGILLGALGLLPMLLCRRAANQ